MSTPVYLHLIAYNEAVRQAIAPGWLVLDNLANERPDWYEYWAIRRYLMQNGPAMDEQACYGFFSPKFSAKTGLSHQATVAAVQAAGADADVVLFSPQPDMGAFFLNVFEQGETFDAGFIAACETWLAHAGLTLPLRHLVMDSRQIVFSNYFAAKPAFWREWLRWNETLFALCEHGPREAAAPLVQSTTYPGAAQRKVFIQERTASLLLTIQPHWRSHPHNPFGMAWSTSRMSAHPEMAVMSDALKRAHRDHGFPAYLQAFGRLRQRFVAAGQAKAG